MADQSIGRPALLRRRSSMITRNRTHHRWNVSRMSGDTAAGGFPEVNKAGDSAVVGERPKVQLSKEATDQTRRLASEVQDRPGKLVSQVGRHVGRLMTGQKNRAADGLHRVAVVLRDKARNLGQQNDAGQS
jgi:hypothetical protein